MIRKAILSKALGCLGAGLSTLAFLCVAFLYSNWGIWRSESYELFGIELPLETVYRTDLSSRGREAGFFMVVYRLPHDIEKQLLEQAIDLSQYPMFTPGFERDGYTRVNWAHGFPSNEIENNIYNYFKMDVAATEIPLLDRICKDTDAELLANHLLLLPETISGGWYKRIYSSGPIWIPHFYFYVLNIERRTLIMFGLDT